MKIWHFSKFNLYWTLKDITNIPQETIHEEADRMYFQWREAKNKLKEEKKKRKKDWAWEVVRILLVES